MFRRRTALHAAALWLTLASVALRGLIPVGFMPGWVAADTQARWLIICPASDLAAAIEAPAGTAAHGHHDHAAMLAATDADPHAGHHGHHGAHGDAAAVADAAPDPHAAHGDDHAGHRIASEHQSCPFAGAVSPALPASVLAVALPPRDGETVLPARQPGLRPASRRRLPPARAPPAVFDTTFA